jgi:hypothetical protein
MQVGITLPNPGIKTIRDNLLETVTQAEKDGFDSVWADNNKQDTIADIN